MCIYAKIHITIKVNVGFREIIQDVLPAGHTWLQVIMDV